MVLKIKYLKETPEENNEKWLSVRAWEWSAYIHCGHRFVTLEDEESDSGFEDDKDTDYDLFNDR